MLLLLLLLLLASGCCWWVLPAAGFWLLLVGAELLRARGPFGATYVRTVPLLLVSTTGAYCLLLLTAATGCREMCLADPRAKHISPLPAIG